MQTTFGIWLEPPLPIQQRIRSFRRNLQTLIRAEDPRQDPAELNFQLFSLPPWFFFSAVTPYEESDSPGGSAGTAAAEPSRAPAPPRAPFWLHHRPVVPVGDETGAEEPGGNTTGGNEPGSDEPACRVFHRDRTAGTFYSPALRSLPTLAGTLAKTTLGPLTLHGIELELVKGLIPDLSGPVHTWKPEQSGGIRCARAFLPLFTMYEGTSYAEDTPRPLELKGTDLPQMPGANALQLPDIRFQRSTVQLARLKIGPAPRQTATSTDENENRILPSILFETLISADLVQLR